MSRPCLRRLRPGGYGGRPTDPGTRIFFSTGTNCGLSAACPAVRTNASGRHLRSAPRWTLLVCPPRERPRKAALSRSFRRRRMRRRSSRSGSASASCPFRHSRSPPLTCPSSPPRRRPPPGRRARPRPGASRQRRGERAVVESTLTKDKSTSPCFAASAITPSSRASKTPASRHCRNRFETVGQAPNSRGISRHCPPVLNLQITPSNCCRSHSGYGPHPPIGKYGSPNSRSLSLSCALVIQVDLPVQPRREGRIP